MGGVALTALLSSSSSALAQVNTEPLRKKVKEKGWSIQLQMNFTGRTGNTEGVDAGGGGGFGFKAGRHSAFVFGNGEYTNFNDTLSVENAFLHARYNYEIMPWLWAELFAQAQTDLFQRIKLRNLLGLGPRFGLYQSKEFDVFVGTSYMLERDVIYVLPDTTEAGEYLVSRWNNYVSVDYMLDTRIEFATTAYLQPAFASFSNYRFLGETSLIFKITTVLSAQITASYHYDSQPPLGALPSDTMLKNVFAATY
jgi:putative salt-induced outer membrane protein YdiY